VQIEFEPAVADYVRAREWHPSQFLSDLSGGGVMMTLDVCRDRSLESWILSFGPFARVVSPDSLAREIAGTLDRARERYRTRAASDGSVAPGQDETSAERKS
jgi:predicted DNA-binding transcriptional regulator YafY